MKNLLISLLFVSPIVLASAEMTPPERAALNFNKWYIGQLEKDASPLTDFTSLNQYVTSETIKSLKKLYSGDSNDKDMPDSDMFIKAQDYNDDWNQVNVISSDFDAACTHVYIAFGDKKNHVIADCMVQENNKWKIRSVTLIK